MALALHSRFPLAGQKRTSAGFCRKMARDTAKYPFAESRMTVSTRDDRAGPDIGCNPVELFGDRRSVRRFRNEGVRHDAVAAQPSRYVFDMRQRIGPFGVLLG